MKRLNQCLKWLLIAIWTCFLAVTVYQCYDYLVHAERYVFNSAPWYLSIQLCGGTALFCSAILLPAIWVLRRKTGK